MTLFTKTNKPTKKLTDTVTEIISLEAQIKELTTKTNNLKALLKESIEATEKPCSIVTDTFAVTYKGATTSVRIDTKRLKDDNLALFQKYSKTSSVKSSISVKAK